MDSIKNDMKTLSAMSPAYLRKLRKSARIFCNENPGSADANGFWKSLSARQVWHQTNKTLA